MTPYERTEARRVKFWHERAVASLEAGEHGEVAEALAHAAEHLKNAIDLSDGIDALLASRARKAVAA